MAAEWKEIAPNVFWCKGCGCVKIAGIVHARYLTPRHERERRAEQKRLKAASSGPGT